MATDDNGNHVHDENCGKAPGFENFGDKDYELVGMAIKAVNKMMGPITSNVVDAEIDLAAESEITLPEVFAAKRPNDMPEDWHAAISLVVFAGAKAMAMCLTALGAIDSKVIVQNQPREDSLADLISRITGLSPEKVSVYEVSKDENGEVQVEAFDPEKHEKESPVDRTPKVLPYGEQEQVASEVAKQLGTDDEDELA